MKTVAFRPLGERYLVAPDQQEEEKTQVGEYSIDRGKNIHEQPASGTVIAKGKFCTELEVGDRVAYGKYSGYDQKVDGKMFKVLQEKEILGQFLEVEAFDFCKDQDCLAEAGPDGYCEAHSAYRHNT